MTKKSNDYKKWPCRDGEKDLLDEMLSPYNSFNGSKKWLKHYFNRKQRRQQNQVDYESEDMDDAS